MAPGECYYNTLLCCEDYFSSLSVVSCIFSALCLYLKFWHHPLGYLHAKFSFFRSLHCWASPWRKIAYSVNHSITRSVTHPVYLMPHENHPRFLSFLVLRNRWMEFVCVVAWLNQLISWVEMRVTTQPWIMLMKLRMFSSTLSQKTDMPINVITNHQLEVLVIQS